METMKYEGKLTRKSKENKEEEQQRSTEEIQEAIVETRTEKKRNLKYKWQKILKK